MNRQRIFAGAYIDADLGKLTVGLKICKMIPSSTIRPPSFAPAPYAYDNFWYLHQCDWLSCDYPEDFIMSNYRYIGCEKGLIAASNRTDTPVLYIDDSDSSFSCAR
jgi:hypothetical protein